MPPTRNSRAHWVRVFSSAVILSLTLLATTGCQFGGADTEPAAKESRVPVGPTLKPRWSRATNMWGPGDQTSGRWWAGSLDGTDTGLTRDTYASYYARSLGVDNWGRTGDTSAPNSNARSRGVVVGNALTGKVRTLPAPHEAPTCDIVALPPREDGAGLFRVGTMGSNGCERYALLDASTGRYDMTEQQRGHERGIDWTWDGVTVVPAGAETESGIRESVTGQEKDGTVLWTGPTLESRSSNIMAVFDWSERVIPTDQGPLLVTYDFTGDGPVPDLGDQPNATLTLLDPKTGKPVREIGRVPGSNLRWVVGDIAIFAKAEGYSSSYEGYQLPGLTARTAWAHTES